MTSAGLSENQLSGLRFFAGESVSRPRGKTTRRLLNLALIARCTPLVGSDEKDRSYVLTEAGHQVWIALA